MHTYVIVIVVMSALNIILTFIKTAINGDAETTDIISILFSFVLVTWGILVL